MSETPDERRSPAVVGRRSSIGWPGRALTWLGMLGGQFLVAALLWAVAAPGLEALVGWAAFFLPLPALALAWIFLRPVRDVPPGLAIEDWGVTLGHAWVHGWGRTYWMPRADMEALAAEPEPAEPKWTHGGFVLEVPPHHHGLPDIAPAAGASLTAVTAPLILTVVVTVLWEWATAPGPMLELGWVAMGALCLVIAYGMLLSPWVAALSAWKSTRARFRNTTVRLEGRQVHVLDGGSFILGAPGQSITLENGVLTLENPNQTLRIAGEASSLATLRDAFERASTDAGSEALVPQALGKLASRVTQ